jgi:hypothetical protein
VHEAKIPPWIELGRKRAEQARLGPHSDSMWLDPGYCPWRDRTVPGAEDSGRDVMTI